MSKKSLILTLIIPPFLLAVGGIMLFWWSTSLVCPAFVMQCPDGSYAKHRFLSCAYRPCADSTIVSLAAPAIPSTSPMDSIDNWQTYRNEEYGFEFRYPEGFEVIPARQNSYWLISKNNCPSKINCRDYEVEFVFDLIGNTSPDKEFTATKEQCDKYSGRSSCQILNDGSVVIGGKNARRATASYLGVYGGVPDSVAKVKTDIWISISDSILLNLYSYDLNNRERDGLMSRETFDKIVSTLSFSNGSQVSSSLNCGNETRICLDGSRVRRVGLSCEFTDCPEISTAGWNIYRNDQYGFAFNYPNLIKGKEVTIREVIADEEGEAPSEMGELSRVTVDSLDRQTIIEFLIFDKTPESVFRQFDELIMATKSDGYLVTKETSKIGLGNLKADRMVMTVKRNDGVGTLFFSATVAVIYRAPYSYVVFGNTSDELSHDLYPKILPTFRFLN